MNYYIAFMFIAPLVVGLLWANLRTKKAYKPKVDPPETTQAMKELSERIFALIKEHPLDSDNYHIEVSVLKSDECSGISVTTSNYVSEVQLVENDESEGPKSHERNISQSLKGRMWEEATYASGFALLAFFILGIIIGHLM